MLIVQQSWQSELPQPEDLPLARVIAIYDDGLLHDDDVPGRLVTA